MDEIDAVTVLRLWGRSEAPIRELSGLNKATWRVGDDYWLTAGDLSSYELWRTVENLVARPELSGFALPRAVPTLDGRVLASFRGKLWRLTVSVNGVVPVPSSPDHLDAVASGLARLHVAMSGLPKEFGVHGISADTYTDRARELVCRDVLPFTSEEKKVIDRGFGCLEDNPVSEGPSRVIHGDPSYPNLRLGLDGALTGLIDWEAVRWDSPLYDLAVVGQTILYRSGWANTLAGLERLLLGYADAGGREFSLKQLLYSILAIKFESIAHHGQKLLDGNGDADLVRSQAGKIEIVCDLILPLC